MRHSPRLLKPATRTLLPRRPNHTTPPALLQVAISATMPGLRSLYYHEPKNECTPPDCGLGLGVRFVQLRTVPVHKCDARDTLPCQPTHTCVWCIRATVMHKTGDGSGGVIACFVIIFVILQGLLWRTRWQRSQREGDPLQVRCACSDVGPAPRALLTPSRRAL